MDSAHLQRLRQASGVAYELEETRAGHRRERVFAVVIIVLGFALTAASAAMLLVALFG